MCLFYKHDHCRGNRIDQFTDAAGSCICFRSGLYQNGSQRRISEMNIFRVHVYDSRGLAERPRGNVSCSQSAHAVWSLLQLV